MKFYNKKFFTFLLVCGVFSFIINVKAQKITAEEVVLKHLDSIGTKENRAAVKNQLIFNNVEFKLKGSTNVINGKGLILSSGEKNLWGMNLNSNDYPQDQFGYNGKDTKVAFSRPGARSIIGDFILSYDDLLKKGLLGGTLSASWALLNIDANKSKVSYEGTKTIDGKDTHILSFSPKGGSDLSIKMYFDKQTYQHLRTEYNRVIAARQGSTVDNSAGQGEDRYRLVEDFSNFTKMGNLTLPGVYKLFYAYSSNASIRLSKNSNREAEWIFKVTNYSFNQALDENSFEINVK
jgi:hypothetical protein